MDFFADVLPLGVPPGLRGIESGALYRKNVFVGTADGRLHVFHLDQGVLDRVCLLIVTSRYRL